MRTLVHANTLSDCMQAMADYVAAYEQTGGYNLVFCEDRLTLIAERAIVKKLGGTFHTNVSTFARFLKTDVKVLSKQGSVMTVGSIMTRLQNQGRLRCFTSATAVGNNAKCIYETIAQFAASEVTSDTLKESMTLLPDDMLKNKISDLAEIYEEYTLFLQENGYVDESKYLALLPQSMKTDKSLIGANIFFLGFTSFTAQAAKTLAAACEVAGNVIGIFCSGKEEIYTGKAPSVFKRVCGEYGGLKELFYGQKSRREGEILRGGLFDPEKLRGEKLATDRIHIFEGADKSDEADKAAALIKRIMQENPAYRYRDIALLIPDVKAYSLPLKKALDEYQIPYFFDEKQSLKSHPLSAFLLDALAIVKENFSPDSVQAFTQNVFFGESDSYRNYLAKYANYRGGARKEIKDGVAVEHYDRPPLVDCRERLLSAVNRIKRRGHGRDYCIAVRGILEDFKTKERLEKLMESFTDTATKAYLSQIYSTLERVLSEMETLIADRELSVAEFAAIFQDGLDATEISLIPLKSDAVFVGDMTESRIQNVKVIFALGLTDSVPRNSTDTALVSDKDIARLAQVQTLLEPTVAEVNLRARESLSLNLCSFTDALYLSYPLSSDGSEPALSDVFRYVKGLFVTGAHKEISVQKKFGEKDFPWLCSAPAPAIRQLLVKKSEFENHVADTRKEYSSLYVALEELSISERDEFLSEQGGQVFVENGEQLFFHGGKISPTALEEYFSCPFKNFVSRGLKLQEREENVVMAFDNGNFIHDLLQEVSKKIETLADESALRDYAKEVGLELLKRPAYIAQGDTKSGQYASENLLKEGVEVATAVYRQLKNSEYKVEDVEKYVASDFYHGRIDRVDSTDKFVRVVDYKTGKIDDSATSYYTGRKLQMQLYMSSVKGERVPGGVFYFPASTSYVEKGEQRFQMKGFLNGSEEALLCGDKNLTEGKKSDYFAASLKNDGRLTKVMDEETFADFIDYAELAARQGAKEIKEGFIAATPYKKGCEYCKFGGMCGFHRDLTEEREEGEISPKTIAAIAHKIKNGEEE